MQQPQCACMISATQIAWDPRGDLLRSVQIGTPEYNLSPPICKRDGNAYRESVWDISPTGGSLYATICAIKGGPAVPTLAVMTC